MFNTEKEAYTFVCINGLVDMVDIVPVEEENTDEM